MADAGRDRASAQGMLNADLSLLSFRDLGERWRRIDPCSDEAGRLADLVESELLPRLMIAFQSFSDGLPMDYVTEVDRERFFSLLIADDGGPVLDFVQQLRRREVPMEKIFGDLLAQAAHTLGERWEEDRLDFTEVAIAMTRLQQILRMNSVVGDVGFQRADGSAFSILLATARGEQHTFGVQLVAEAFRRDGWFVSSEAGTELDILRQIVAREGYDFIGYSASSDRVRDTIAGDLEVLRAESRNPDIRIMVGGGVFQRHAGLVEEVGAAFCANDALSAPMLCRNLLAQSLVGC